VSDWAAGFLFGVGACALGLAMACAHAVARRACGKPRQDPEGDGRRIRLVE
jgi:hypothetical protein